VGLDLLKTLDDNCIAEHHRLHAVGRICSKWPATARRLSYQTAARRTTSLPEQRYLQARAARLIDEQ
jgi:hypothetical protein